jgi:hypothetical protein
MYFFEIGANMIAGVGMFLLVVLAGLVTFMLHQYWLLIPILIALVAYASILYAYYSRRDAAYWPFLIVNV